VPIRIKRAYEEPSRSDGLRVLVDRLWPRGLKKEDAAIDQWRKELAPSDGLRRWFGHDPERWQEFRRRYLVELENHEDELVELAGEARNARVTLVFGARDAERNNAVVLRERLVGADGLSRERSRTTPARREAPRLQRSPPSRSSTAS
jgi:uncharacterized protein YeaO (DUF488 family)